MCLDLVLHILLAVPNRAMRSFTPEAHKSWIKKYLIQTYRVRSSTSLLMYLTSPYMFVSNISLFSLELYHHSYILNTTYKNDDIMLSILYNFVRNTLHKRTNSQEKSFIVFCSAVHLSMGSCSHNFIANALELRLSCINPSIWGLQIKEVR